MNRALSSVVMRLVALLFVLGWVIGLTATISRAAPIPSLESAATQLREATVTVRVHRFAKVPEKRGKPKAAGRVTVCSGVSVGDGMIVTFVNASGGARIRVTLPDGKQAEASPRVIDHYSGLTLLDTGVRNLKSVSLGTKKAMPKVGGWVLSAAAWGIEKPVVSFGILSGTKRSIRGAAFPPLLQCDLRTAETSSGAGLVDQHGKLIGVVVAAESSNRRNGWTYAIPVEHVRRLMRVRSGKKLVVLKRRRPVAGLVLKQGKKQGTVVVQHIMKDGPAAKAGIQVGDQVLASDGVAIRSVYQVVVPLLRKRPGDTMLLRISRKGAAPREMRIILGGGVELPATNHFAGAIGLVNPKVEVAQEGLRQFTLRNDGGTRKRAVDAIPPPTSKAKAEQAAKQMRQMHKALQNYGKLVTQLQKELQRNEEERQALKAEIIQLHKQLAEKESR